MNKVKEYLYDSFNLTDDNASIDEIRSRIISGANIKGSNMSILIFAIMIASIGLNMNSTAVIIGAMLISPLMGSIMGVAFGIATANMNHVKNYLIGFALQIIISLVTSTLYFSITPISTTTSELLARTSPTIWDVLIATFGGFAGVIGVTRIEKSNVIPGVAIATALMPPLCTTGYGIATGQTSYALGAFYLFILNSYCICLTSVIVFFILKVPKESVILTAMARKKALIRLSVFTIVLLVPSVIFAANLVQQDDITGFTEQTAQLRDLNSEVKILFPEVDRIETGNVEYLSTEGPISTDIVMIYVSADLAESEQDKLLKWVTVRVPEYDVYKIVEELKSESESDTATESVTESMTET
ncbi:MAG: DUF389 domain-containing protein [Lachnospiraceae bacterium]